MLYAAIQINTISIGACLLLIGLECQTGLVMVVSLRVNEAIDTKMTKLKKLIDWRIVFLYFRLINTIHDIYVRKNWRTRMSHVVIDL